MFCAGYWVNDQIFEHETCDPQKINKYSIVSNCGPIRDGATIRDNTVTVKRRKLTRFWATKGDERK